MVMKANLRCSAIAIIAKIDVFNITISILFVSIGLVLMFGMICFCSFDEQKGIALGATYRNKTQAKEFTYYIAEAERN